MINAVNTANVNAYGNTSFAKKREKASTDFNMPQMEVQRPKKGSKFGRALAYAFTQFAAGALLSVFWDTATNAYRLIKKNKPVIPTKNLAVNAAKTGGLFVLVSAAFSVIFGIAGALKNKKEQ